MNATKILMVSVIVFAVIGAILWPLFSGFPGYSAAAWLVATVVSGLLALLFGPDVLPRRIRRRLFAWLSHD